MANVTEHPEMYGYTLAAAVTFSYVASVPLFLKAGQKYKEFKEKFQTI